MKIGAEDRKKVIAAVVLVAVAIPLALYAFKGVFWGSNASAAPSVSPLPPKATGALPAQDNSDPRLRTDILDASRKIKYEEGGRNIFTMEVKIETPIAPVKRNSTDVPYWTPTPTPPPPPIPIKYYGFANKPAEPRKIFLQQEGAGQQIFVASLGDIVARRYRVIQIAPNSITMEDVLTGNRQAIPLTVK
ncbi:MAG TPA: hypothetical protein VI488_18540 [Candidatus Angelobacter sp.]